jgi:adenylate kinase
MTEARSINMVLLGPPGAGKGTQAAHLIKAYGLLHISTGDMLREAVKEGGDIGKELASYMNEGKLVPDGIVTRTVVERMAKPDAQGGVILDGYPRTRPQAESLDSSLDASGRTLDVVIYFSTSDEVAIQRLSGRRVCKDCGKNYHATNMPPKQEGICDICGAKLYQREDDKPETVKNRLTVYEKSTKDLIEYYRTKGLLKEVDGGLPAKDLFNDIDVLLKKDGLI